MYQDIFSSPLIPYIQKSVEHYYTKFLNDITKVDPWAIDILNNKSLNFEKAVKQGHVVEISSPDLSSGKIQYHTEIYNIDKFESFIKNINDRKPAKIRIVKYSREHGLTWVNKLYDLEYNGEK